MKRKYFAFALIIVAFASLTSGCYVEYDHHHHYDHDHYYHHDHDHHGDWDDR